MPYELKEGQGSLFKNDRKESDNHPDYRGEIKINGEVMWLSAWIKEGQRGKFMSLSVKPKEDRPQRQAKPAARNHPSVDDDDSLPF